MSKGKWLVLARTRHMLNDLENVLYANGMYYRNKFKKAYEKDLYEAVMDWESFRKGKQLNGEQLKRIASYMKPDQFSRKGLKNLYQIIYIL